MSKSSSTPRCILSVEEKYAEIEHIISEWRKNPNAYLGPDVEAVAFRIRDIVES